MAILCLAAGCAASHEGSDLATAGQAADLGDLADGPPASACADPDDPVFPSCVLDPAGYRTMAAAFDGTAAMDWRYGPTYSTYHPVPETFPTSYAPAVHHFDNHGNGSGWDWQIGGPEDDSKNNYSTDQAQIIYSADASDDHGVDVVQTIIMGDNLFGEEPALPWVYYGGGHPEPNLLVPAWQTLNGGPIAHPAAQGRSYGYVSWGTQAVEAFTSGFIGTAGTNTSNESAAIVKLPPGKVPTAVTVTSNNELALVAVWDTVHLKGQVAVLALAGYLDWADLNPGLRNQGDFAFMKLLGFVDLPDMVAPTEISASADIAVSANTAGAMVPINPDGSAGNGYASESDLPLSVKVNRQSFIGNGPNADRYAKAGYAVVVSKAERKATFIDLKPLFQEIENMYFGSDADYAKARTPGMDPAEWPYTFDVAPDSAPAVIKTISFDEKPTAVRTSIWTGVDEAYVATQDGTLHVFSMAGYASNQPARASDIVEARTIAVGKNVTCLAYAKHDPRYMADEIDGRAVANELVVVSRGDRSVTWTDIRGAGSVVRTLRDSRLIDPLWADDGDNSGTQSYVLTIADHDGRQVVNYRFGPVVYVTNGGASYGMGADGMAQFEFGGAYAVAGKPFQITGSNVP